VGLIQYGNGFYESFNYKVSGLVEEKGLWAPGSAAWLSAWYSYNDEGQRTSLKYPDVYDLQGQIVSTGRTINSTYDSMGRLASIRDPGLGGGTDMVSGALYNAAGQLTQMTVAWEGTRTFNYNTLGQLTRQTSPGVDLEYIFPSTDNDGRLWKKKDWLSGEEVTYQYDEIGRLTAAATTGPAWGLSWTYDGFGNRSAQTVTKGSAPAMSVSVNPATNRVVGLGYDNNGNQTNWTTPLGPVTAAYDVDNRLASISTPNGSEVYAYSSANQRLRKQGKLYFYGVGGELLVEYDFAYGGGGTTPLNPRTQVYFGGMLVFGEGDRRITTDRLGSTVRTEGYFQPEYRYRYYPYGEQQGGSSNEDQVKFGTYWRDSVSGLDYAQNRYFASSQGRFTSADPYVMSGGMGNPQGWNRYAYVGSDPMNRMDPQGLQARAPKFDCTYNSEGQIVDCYWYEEPGLGPSSGYGVGPSLSDLVMSRIGTARKQLLDSKSLLNPDCQDLLHAIWSQDEDIPFSMTAFTDAIANASLKAAETSSDLYADLWKFMSPETYTSQQIKYGSLTISSSLREQGLRFVAASQYYGNLIYFSTDAFSDATYSDIATTLIHEAFHLIGFAESDVAGAKISDSVVRDKCVH
jgi:RHS repeat-associated protein